MHAFEVKNGELTAALDRMLKEAGVTDAVLVSMIGVVKAAEFVPSAALSEYMGHLRAERIRAALQARFTGLPHHHSYDRGLWRDSDLAFTGHLEL